MAFCWYSTVFYDMFESLTFTLFLQEFLKGQIVVSVTIVKKMKKNSDFSYVAASENRAKSVNVKFFQNHPSIMSKCG